jgi:hypothetical protein
MRIWGEEDNHLQKRPHSFIIIEIFDARIIFFSLSFSLAYQTLFIPSF